MRMENKTNTSVDATSNVIPFPERKRATAGCTTQSLEVDVLLCSLCEGKDFMLIAAESQEIACAGCGFAIGAKWSVDNEQL